jgi:hypothetical protein
MVAQFLSIVCVCDVSLREDKYRSCTSCLFLIENHYLLEALGFVYVTYSKMNAFSFLTRITPILCVVCRFRKCSGIKLVAWNCEY